MHIHDTYSESIFLIKKKTKQNIWIIFFLRALSFDQVTYNLSLKEREWLTNAICVSVCF